MGAIWKDRRGKPDMPQKERLEIAERMSYRQLRLAELAERVEVEGDVITFYGTAPKSKIRQRLIPPKTRVVGDMTVSEMIAFDPDGDFATAVRRAMR